MLSTLVAGAFLVGNVLAVPQDAVAETFKPTHSAILKIVSSHAAKSKTVKQPVKANAVLRAQSDEVGWMYFTQSANPMTPCVGLNDNMAMKYGVCVVSGDSETSYKISFDSVDEDTETYSFTQSYYNSSDCDFMTMSQDWTFVKDECDDGNTFTGTSASFSPWSGSLNAIFYNTESACDKGNVNNAISAYGQTLFDCQNFELYGMNMSASTTCDAGRQVWSDFDCEGEPNADDDDGAVYTPCSAMADDDFYSYYDYAYEPNMFGDMQCGDKSSASAITALPTGLVFGALSAIAFYLM